MISKRKYLLLLHEVISRTELELQRGIVAVDCITLIDRTLAIGNLTMPSVRPFWANRHCAGESGPERTKRLLSACALHGGKPVLAVGRVLAGRHDVEVSTLIPGAVFCRRHHPHHIGVVNPEWKPVILSVSGVALVHADGLSFWCSIHNPFFT